MSIKSAEVSEIASVFVVIQTEQNNGGHWSKCLGMFNTDKEAKDYAKKVFPNGKSQGSYDDAINGSVQVLEVPKILVESIKFDQFDEDSDE